jgi:hypothetical protein
LLNPTNEKSGFNVFQLEREEYPVKPMNPYIKITITIMVGEINKMAIVRSFFE